MEEVDKKLTAKMAKIGSSTEATEGAPFLALKKWGDPGDCIEVLFNHR